MRAYIASSWRNATRVSALAAELRTSGHEVFDFTKQVGATHYDEFPPYAIGSYGRYLDSIRDGCFDQIVTDVREVTAADVLVLLLPCGCDAHFELGLAYGLGINTVIVGRPDQGKWVGMHLLASAILESDADVAGCLTKMEQRNGA